MSQTPFSNTKVKKKKSSSNKLKRKRVTTKLYVYSLKVVQGSAGQGSPIGSTPTQCNFITIHSRLVRKNRNHCLGKTAYLFWSEKKTL